MKKRKVGILTGGGDVQPLNALLNSVCKSASKFNIDVLGFIGGWQGVLNNEYVNLNNIAIDPLIGGTILKSSRVNLSKVENGSLRVLEALNQLEVETLIVIGGEDTLSNSFCIKEFPQILISKTIDNDVGIINEIEITNYFTIGHPTAAEKISSFVSFTEGLRTTAYSHERIIVVESMGMHAGWLALSSSMGHPDFIIIPEFPLDYNLFVDKVKNKFLEQRHVIIVVAEGARWTDGKYIAADENEKDSFGHPRFKGAVSLLAEKLKSDLKKDFDTRNVNSVNPSYLYRSGKPNDLDLAASKKLGEQSIKLFNEKINSPIFLTTNFNNNELGIVPFSLIGVDNIESLHRFVSAEYYDKEQLNITEKGRNFVGKIVREFPKPNYKPI